MVESKPAYCHKCYADLKHSQNWFGVLNLLTLLLNLLKTAEILPWRRYESVISNKEPTKAKRKILLRLKGSGKVCFAQHKLTAISPSKRDFDDAVRKTVASSLVGDYLLRRRVEGFWICKPYSAVRETLQTQQLERQFTKYSASSAPGVEPTTTPGEVQVQSKADSHSRGQEQECFMPR